MAFAHLHAPHATPTATDPIIVLRGDHVLTRTGAPADLQLPVLGDLPATSTADMPLAHLGRLDGAACWLRAVNDPEAPPPAGCAWQETRAALAALNPAQLQAVHCARTVHWWNKRHRYCGCCGAPTVDAKNERAKHCPQCGASFFPSASPAVIVAVTRGEQLLLAHNRNFRAGMFSLLAGFLDPGETLEQAVEREVREETGIEIGGLRYVSSQPWPFPNSIMAGFRAEHVSGEITVDGHEIEQAGWFTRDALPDIPRLGTVARELIDAWRNESIP